jgi:hypothetical protein
MLLVAQLCASQNQLTVSIIKPADLSAHVEKANIERDSGRRANALEFSLVNDSADPITGIDVTIYVYDASGKVTHSEGWAQAVSAPPHATQKLHAGLGYYVGDFEKVTMGLRTVITPKGSNSIKIAEMNKAAKSADISSAEIIRDTLLPVTKPFACDPMFCGNARQSCFDLCTQQGGCVTHFACNQTNCSYDCNCDCF